tara:strand:+ start:663 stop:1403 length:741 start_codon:yes stop_codon:yes gene_type:complete
MNIIDATLRDTKTKGQLSNLREKGDVPAIVYGGKEENAKISITKKQVKILIEKENFSSDVITLKLNGKEYPVLPREITFDTVSDEPIHIDFLRIVTGSQINLDIPVKFINHDKSPGLKRGGVLNIVRRKVELNCPTENIPKEIIVDLNNLDIGSSIKISFVNLPENVKPTISDRDFVIATVAAPTVVKEPEKQAETNEDGEVTSEASADSASATGDEKEKGKDNPEGEKSKDGDKKEDQKTTSDKK